MSCTARQAHWLQDQGKNYYFVESKLRKISAFCTAHEPALQSIGIRLFSGFSLPRLTKRSISLLIIWEATVYELWKERIQRSHLDTTLPISGILKRLNPCSETEL